jgi:release factor glutamine methyltransferase
MKIYKPSDDSYLFQNFLEQYLSNLQSSNPDICSKIKLLDMGTGSGILSKTAIKFLAANNILAADINTEAIKNLSDEKFKTVHSNLFQTINQKFDLIIFNAPYLPRDSREPSDSQIATTGGQRGDEISLQFLKQAQSHLNPNGKILLLISSLTPINKIKKLWEYKIVARKKLFMEELSILEFQNDAA